MNPEEFEQELKMALRREAAPDGFAARVMARARPPGRRYVRWAVAAGLVLAALVPAGVYERQREQSVRAEEAKREVMVALRIAQAKLRHARVVVQRGIHRG